MTTRAAALLRRVADEVDSPSLNAAIEQLKSLVVDPPRLVDPPCQNCGWEVQFHAADKGVRAGCDQFSPGPPGGTPFFSETFLYDLLGKEDARSVLAVVNDVLRAAGVDDMELL